MKLVEKEVVTLVLNDKNELVDINGRPLDVHFVTYKSLYFQIRARGYDKHDAIAAYDYDSDIFYYNIDNKEIFFRLQGFGDKDSVVPVYELPLPLHDVIYGADYVRDKFTYYASSSRLKEIMVLYHMHYLSTLNENSNFTVCVEKQGELNKLFDDERQLLEDVNALINLINEMDYKSFLEYSKRLKELIAEYNKEIENINSDIDKPIFKITFVKRRRELYNKTILILMDLELKILNLLSLNDGAVELDINKFKKRVA